MHEKVRDYMPLLLLGRLTQSSTTLEKEKLLEKKS